MIIPEILPKRLVEVREKNGYTRKRLAEELKRPYRTITNYESGEREPGHEYIIEIAKKFGVTTDYLLGMSDNPQPESTSIQLPQTEQGHLNKYRTLDEYGKEVVDSVLDIENRRCEAERLRQLPRQDTEFAVDLVPVTKIIPLFGNSFAAGRGDPDFGNPWEDYEVPIDTVADFAVRISGDSMEPYLPDGSIQLCRKGDPSDGEVAALLVDGTFVCKQVCKDMYGNLNLFSLNRARADADQIILQDSGRSVSCFGTVIMRERVPLPDWLGR